jgi:hypothetical protein
MWSSRWWWSLAFGAAVVVILVNVLSGGDRFQWVPGAPNAGPGRSVAPPVTITPPPPPTAFLYVSPTGSDDNDGSANAPLRTIQAGLDRAAPGMQITLAPGVYQEELQTTRDGTADAPIWIKGPETGTDRAGRYQAVVYGTSRVISVDNSYYVFDGFTIDGQQELADVAFPTDLSGIDAFKQSVQPQVQDGRLIYVGAGDESRDLTGITIRNMFLSGAGGECVRLRNNAYDNVVVDSVIQYCGMYGKGDDDERATFHNGEGVYIGTSPNSDDQPMHDNDTSSRNLVVRNIIRTFGSECFNVKENAHDNVFEGNRCSANTEPADFDGSNVELRGHQNVVRNNTIADSAGYSVKIASDDDYDAGGNVVENNQLTNSVVALKLETESTQGAICGNTVATRSLIEIDDEDNTPGDITAPC